MKWLVVFLGNPGDGYRDTRHNAGWIVSDELSDESLLGLSWGGDKYSDSELARLDNVIYCKPQTFMNRSGVAVQYLCKKESIAPENVIALYDDIDVLVGDYKISFGKGDGNHNGVKSIIDSLGTKNFIRIRIGVGVPERRIPLRGFVLGSLGTDEVEKIQGGSKVISELISDIISKGLTFALNKYSH